MTAPKRDNRRFTASRSMFGKKGSTYKCGCCGRMTRETGLDESSLELCAYCLEESYLENALSDGNIEQPQFEVDLDKLQKAYKRGKYAANEADKKTRKIQSSRYVAPQQEVLDAIVEAPESKFQAATAAVGKAIKAHKAAQAATQSKGKDSDMIVVKVGWGIEQVMQLDDAGVRREWGLEIMNDMNTKATMVLKATRGDMINFMNACADRISSQYDQPLWYMSSAKATVAKIKAALGGK